MEFLRNHGYDILNFNVSVSRFGEIDIIAKKGEKIIFVEVKYRKGPSHGLAIESLSQNKCRKLARTIIAYSISKKISIDNIQCDFVAIQETESGREFEHVENIELPYAFFL